MAHIMTRSLTGELLASIDTRPNKDDLAAAALHLLDWLGCALGGAVEPMGHAIAVAAGHCDIQGTHPLSPKGRNPPELAWGLGGFGSLLEMDDVHRGAILHPGPVVMPAVLACSSPTNAHRAAEAILRGYEAMIRLGRAVGQGHYAQFHNTATCGGLGAAVAAAWMLGLDETPTQWAMAHALSTSGGLWECRNEPGGTKHIHVAEAVRRGVQAAFAAQAGIAGPLHILEGAQGFFAGLAPDGNPEVMLSGPLWALRDTSFKPWPACRHTHPSIDAALALRSALEGRVPDNVIIETFRDAILFCDKPAPAETAAARFSLQHSVAVALLDGPPTLAAFETEALGRQDYVALRARIQVSEDSELTAAYPAHFGARLILHVDGSTLSHNIIDAWGDRENPMSQQAVIDKFQGLAAWGGVSKAKANMLKDAALDVAHSDGAAVLLHHMSALTLVDKHSSRA